MKLASRSAIESANSAKAGSKTSTAGCARLEALGPEGPAPSRRDDLEFGRKGVVGRDEGRGRELDRFPQLPSISFLKDSFLDSGVFNFRGLGRVSELHAWFECVCAAPEFGGVTYTSAEPN